MKREIPILLTVICGLLVAMAFFAPAPDAARGLQPTVWQAINTELLEWAKVLVAVAFLLGIANVVRINLRQIAARHADRWYKAVLIVSLLGFLAVGIAEMHEGDLPAPLLRALVPPDTVTLADGRQVDAWVLSTGSTEITLRDGPGLQERRVPAAEVASVTTRSLKMWIYFKVFSPLQATMFSLLAFYVASATFRAFRARSLEATLLLVAGVLVMLGQVTLGNAAVDATTGQVQKFLMDNFVKAAERAIAIGASFGVLATGLRIVLGLERSYLSE